MHLPWFSVKYIHKLHDLVPISKSGAKPHEYCEPYEPCEPHESCEPYVPFKPYQPHKQYDMYEPHEERLRNKVSKK